MLPGRRGKGLLLLRPMAAVAVAVVSWLSFLEGVGSSYSVETGLARVDRISSLKVGLRNAGCVSSRERGLVRAECLVSPLGAGLRVKAVLRLSSRGTVGVWVEGGDEGITGKRSRFEPPLRGLGLRCMGTTWTLVRGLMGLGLGPSSARIWAFWMAMRSQETRPGFDWPGRGVFCGSRVGEFGWGGEYFVAGNSSGL